MQTNWLTVIQVGLYCICFFHLSKSTKAITFFAMATGGILVVHFFSYPLYVWHWLFVLIYLMVAMWLFLDEYPTAKFSFFFISCFAALCVWNYYGVEIHNFSLDNQTTFKEFIRRHKAYLASRHVFVGDYKTRGFLPLLQENDIVGYDLQSGLEMVSFQNLQIIYTSVPDKLNYETATKNLSLSTENILLSKRSTISNIQSYQKNQPYQLVFEEQDCVEQDDSFCLYRVKKDPRDRDAVIP